MDKLFRNIMITILIILVVVGCIIYRIVNNVTEFWQAHELFCLFGVVAAFYFTRDDR